jgi:hypothetical protein
MRHLPTFVLLFSGAFLAACAGAEPAPKAPVARDSSAYQPAEYVEMSFDGKAEDEAPKPVATPTPRAADKPNVATQTSRRGLFGIAKKTKD